MSVRLPPRYVHLPAWLVYSDLPAAVQRTGERIYGLAWETRARRATEDKATDLAEPVVVLASLEELMAVCGLSRARLFAHLRCLVNRGVLRYTYPRRGGIYVLELPAEASWPSVGDAGPVEEEARGPPDVGVEACAAPTVHNKSLKNETVPTLSAAAVGSADLRSRQQQQQGVSGHGGGVGGVRQESQKRDSRPVKSLENETVARSTVSKMRLKGGQQCEEAHSGVADLEARTVALKRMGIREPTRSELAGLAWATPGYLEAWAEWLEVQEDVGTGLVIEQIRLREEAPELTPAERRELRDKRDCGAWYEAVVQR